MQLCYASVLCAWRPYDGYDRHHNGPTNLSTDPHLKNVYGYRHFWPPNRVEDWLGRQKAGGNDSARSLGMGYTWNERRRQDWQSNVGQVFRYPDSVRLHIRQQACLFWNSSHIPRGSSIHGHEALASDWIRLRDEAKFNALWLVRLSKLLCKV